jgi:periplasmic protein TonB
MSDSMAGLNLNANLARLGRPREFGATQQNPVRRFGGIAVAAVLHILLIWALVSGLATKVVHIVQQPIETRIIEPVKPPPPPPPPKIQHIVERPHLAPPPPFVPPPEVHVTPPPAPTITHQEAPVPSAPVQAAPPAPVPVAKPVSHEVGVVCPNSDEIRSSMSYPQEAQDNDITGDVTVEFTVDGQGSVSNMRVVQHADPLLERAALNTVKRFHCVGQGQSVRVQVPFSFNLN